MRVDTKTCKARPGPNVWCMVWLQFGTVSVNKIFHTDNVSVNKVKLKIWLNMANTYQYQYPHVQVAASMVCEIGKLFIVFIYENK